MILSIAIVAALCYVRSTAAATPSAEDRLSLHFTDEAIRSGYTAEYQKQEGAAWGDFRVGILPNLVNEEITLEMRQFHSDKYPDPAGMTRVSDYYLYDILRHDQANKDPLVLNKPFYLALRFNSGNLWRKRIFFWTGTSEGWRALPSSIDYVNGYVRAITHLPFSRIAVFEDHNGTEGYASWYRSSRYSFGAASNDFPLGTKLRIRNIDNGKTVDVTVQSGGPYTPFEQRRVVDLTYDGFSQIANPWEGTARVQVSALDSNGKVLGIDTVFPSPVQAAPAVPEPHPASKAVVAINERTEEILYSKNYDTVLPIASLTKLMTAFVFLGTNTPMDQVVTYDSDDDADGSKLYVSPGETMTVKDLYYTMLVGSANNAANALARSTGLSREEFVRRMNDTAQQWGLTHTRFVDPTGLDPANVSTVYELALMARNSMKDFRILQGTTTWSYGFITINTGKLHVIKNTAPEMQGSTLYITGMKTGYLDEAGYCFIFKARSNKDGTNHAITVVLGAESKDQRIDDTNQLMAYALAKL